MLNFRLEEAVPQVASPVVLTLEEAAAYLRLPGDAVARQAAESAIPGRLVAGEWRFLQSALDEWLGSLDRRRALLRQAGTFADDESLAELRAVAYKERGRPETDSEP